MRMIRNLPLVFIGSIFIASVIASFFGVVMMFEEVFPEGEAITCAIVVFLVGSASIICMRKNA